MIKAGIAGAVSPRSGELIRILVHHPEVELSALFAPLHVGKRVDYLHHGLIGETELKFTDRLDIRSLDVVFIDDCPEAASIIAAVEEAGVDAPRVIDMTGQTKGRDKFVCGVSEIYRKSMVRGATCVYIPSAVAVVALVALYPFAANLMLNASLKLDVEAPKDIDADGCGELVAEKLSLMQHSFAGGVEVTLSESSSSRGLRLRTRIASTMPTAEIVPLYESIYDDHRFTFISNRKLHLCEVEGTEKCLICVSQSEPGIIEIEAIADCRLRGGAGEAVHTMNLLFALHEKTGLDFKASTF